MWFGEHLIIGISGKSLTESEKNFIVKNNIGGVILFGRNVESPKQVHALNTEIQALSKLKESKAPLWIGVDMEGGRVARLRAPLTVWPPLQRLGEIDSAHLSFQYSFAMGTELLSLGFNLDFAPVLDVFTNPKNTVIGDRSIGSDAELVSKHGSALVRGYIKSGIVPCGKHFPGHGNTLLDSHEELPIETITLAELEARELIPFRKAFRSQLEMVMTAHIRYTNLDSENCATLSAYVIQTLLRDSLRYQGLIITDDLGMKAISKYIPTDEVPLRALNAGHDLLLYCNEPQAPEIAIESIAKSLKDKRLDEAQLRPRVKRILDFKKGQLNSEFSDWETTEKLIGCEDHQKIRESLLATSS